MYKTAIILLTYNFEKKAELFFEKIKNSLELRKDVVLIIIDNNSKDNTKKIIKNELNKHENYIFIENKENFGFAKGNNIGIKKAKELKCKFIILLNDDAYPLDENWIEKFENNLEKNNKLACSGCVILDSNNKKINSAGINLCYNGIGYCQDFNKEYNKKNYTEYIDKGYAMGAALIIKIEILEKLGYFKDEYFLYHEDSELQIRFILSGYKIGFINETLIEHDYNFNSRSGKNKFYYIERNRLFNIFSQYKIKTLILLFPIIIFWELGILLFSIKENWFYLKIKAYKDFFQNIKNIKKWRKENKKIRIIKDRELLKHMNYNVKFSEIDNILIKYIANPVSFIYYLLLKIIIWW
ncbi:glycosyltransferase family 2 protein [Patescibacteria group bacterium]|nr:glycosyltransferase family 2 protein [Patescibacteria group bacterium]